MLYDNDGQVLGARENQVEFFVELTNGNPSLARLDSIGQAIAKWTGDASSSFQKLLRLNPNSVVAMRRYATFLNEVRQCGHVDALTAVC